MSDPTKLRLVLMSDDLFHELGASKVTWGSPVEYVQGRPVYAPAAVSGGRNTASARRTPPKERARRPADHEHDFSVKLIGGWEACPRCWETQRVGA